MAILSLFKKKKSELKTDAAVSTVSSSPGSSSAPPPAAIPKQEKARKMGDDGLPVSKRTITFAIDTGATFGPDNIPLIYATPEAPAQLIASITFECDLDCIGDTFDVDFKATAGVKVNDFIVNDYVDNSGGIDHRTGTIYLQELQKKRWQFPLERLEGQPRIIPKGSYTNKIRVVLDPLLPSSANHRRNWVEYQFHAQLTKFDPFSRTNSPTVEATQKIWVLNAASFAPHLYNTLSLSGNAFKKSLDVSVSLPSHVVELGQSLPLTVKVEPFTSGSKHAGKELVVVSGSFKLVETRIVKIKDSGPVSPIVEDVVNIPLVSPWPISANGWSRMININLPSSPELTPTTESNVQKTTHVLHLKLKVKPQGEKDRNAEEIKLQADIKVGVPKPSGVFRLPEYKDDNNDNNT
ncbi:hypothetical protein BG004_003067, partial [Podila humilis]